MKPRSWLAGAAIAAVAIAGACAWMWAPWRWFAASEVSRVAYPLRDVGLAFPPGREGVDYYGTLRMDVYIDAEGRVDRVRVLESSVPASFRDGAVRAFEATRFDPAVRFGRPVKSVKRVEVEFKPPAPGVLK